MYAYFPETGRGFIDGVCDRGISQLLFATHPHHTVIRELTQANFTAAAEHFEG